MMHRPDRVLRPWAVGVLAAAALAVVVPASRAQPDQAKAPKLLFCVIATKDDDEDALTRAQKYFADLKDNTDQQKQEDARKEKGDAPAFPNPGEKEGPGLVAEAALGA